MVEKECSKFGGAKTVMRRSVVIYTSCPSYQYYTLDCITLQYTLYTPTRLYYTVAQRSDN